MSENGHLAHSATLKKLVKEGWFREPLRSQMLAVLQERMKAFKKKEAPLPKKPDSDEVP